MTRNCVSRTPDDEER